MTTDASTKEEFFERLGALILAARFIAQGRPVADAGTEEAGNVIVGR